MSAESERGGRIESGGGLLLRPWRVDDAAGLRSAIDEKIEHLQPWLTWTLEEPATIEHTAARLLDYVDQMRTGEAYRYAITPLERPAVILGGAHLNARVGPGGYDLGYWVRHSAAGQGVAGSAVSRLIVHTFTDPATDRLVIHCDVANTASAGIARALGFRSTSGRTASYPDGSPRPLLEFEMSREEYMERHATALSRRASRVHFDPGRYDLTRVDSGRVPRSG